MPSSRRLRSESRKRLHSGISPVKEVERNAETIVPLWQRDTTRNQGDYVNALVTLSWDNAYALAATSFQGMSWSQIRAEHQAAIAANDHVKLALIEDKTKRATFAENVGRPSLADIEAQFQLTKGRTGEIGTPAGESPSDRGAHVSRVPEERATLAVEIHDAEVRGER